MAIFPMVPAPLGRQMAPQRRPCCTGANVSCVVSGALCNILWALAITSSATMFAGSIVGCQKTLPPLWPQCQLHRRLLRQSRKSREDGILPTQTTTLTTLTTRRGQPSLGLPHRRQLQPPRTPGSACAALECSLRRVAAAMLKIRWCLQENQTN